MATSTGATKPPFLLNRNFALLWIGQVISSIGDFVFDTTGTLWIATQIAKDQTWAPLAVSGLALAITVPTIIIGPFAGVFADRWDKRRTMLVMNVLRALLVLSLVLIGGVPFGSPTPVAAGSGIPIAWQLAIIYATVFLDTTCAQLFSPSRMALIGDIVEGPLRPRASSLMFMTLSLGLVLGPPLAAPLYFAVGVQWALVLDAASFLISFAAIVAIRAPRSARSVVPGETSSVLRELVEGLRFFMANRVLRTIVVATALTLLGTGAINALNVFFITENLHGHAEMLGMLGVGSGAGILAGSLLAGRVAERLGVPRTFWLATTTVGLMLLLYARLQDVPSAVLMLFLIGIVSAGVHVAIGPMLLHVTPREMVGRVTAVLNPATSFAAFISVALSGYLASTLLAGFHAEVLGLQFGAIDTIYLVSGLLVLAGGLYAAANLRGYGRGALLPRTHTTELLMHEPHGNPPMESHRRCPARRQ